MGNVVALREAPQRQAPRRRPNAELRTREHLTAQEVEPLIEAANGNRHGHRDATMVLLAFRHGLRVSELVDLRWDQVALQDATLHVRRVKAGTPARIRYRPRDARPAQAVAGERELALRLRVGAEGAVLDGRVREDAGACR